MEAPKGVARAVERNDEAALARALKTWRGSQSAEAMEALSEPLIEAVRSRKAGCVAALLEAGASAEAQDRSGQSALQWAAFCGAAECARLLIEAGADVERPLKKNDRQRPLLTALRSRSAKTVQTLLEAGAKALEPDGESRARLSAQDLLKSGLLRQDEALIGFATEAIALLEKAELLELSAPGARAPLATRAL